MKFYSPKCFQIQNASKSFSLLAWVPPRTLLEDIRLSICFKEGYSPSQFSFPLNAFGVSLSGPVFTARCYASAVLAMGPCLSVRVRVRLSVTSRSSTKTAKRRITQTTPHDTPKTLVFWCQRSPRNSTGVTPYEGAECRWGGSKSATFD